MRHLTTNSKRFQESMLPRKAILIWSDPSMDGYSYSFVYRDGAKGILMSGGLSGDTQIFRPLYQKGF